MLAVACAAVCRASVAGAAVPTVAAGGAIAGTNADPQSVSKKGVGPNEAAVMLATSVASIIVAAARAMRKRGCLGDRGDCRKPPLLQQIVVVFGCYTGRCTIFRLYVHAVTQTEVLRQLLLLLQLLYDQRKRLSLLMAGDETGGGRGVRTPGRRTFCHLQTTSLSLVFLLMQLLPLAVVTQPGLLKIARTAGCPSLRRQGYANVLG